MVGELLSGKVLSEVGTHGCAEREVLSEVQGVLLSFVLGMRATARSTRSTFECCSGHARDSAHHRPLEV